MTKRLNPLGDELDYTDTRVLSRLWQRLTHTGQRIVVDIEAVEVPRSVDDALHGRVSPVYRRTDRWGRWPAAQLYAQGYLKTRGLYDSILWWGVPVFVRIKGVEEFDVHVRDEYGEWVYSQEGPARLNDILSADLIGKALKAFARVQVSKMDIQKIAMIAILGAGAILGMMALGVLRWSSSRPATASSTN